MTSGLARTLREITFGQRVPIEHFEAETFGGLNPGDKYISLPVPGDNSGHGGFKGKHHISMKIDGVKADNVYNSVRLCDGALSTMLDNMCVVRVG